MDSEAAPIPELTFDPVPDSQPREPKLKPPSDVRVAGLARVTRDPQESSRME
jgi:hypothetical protein